MASERLLQLRGVTWHFRRRVPANLQAELGKREFTEALSRDLHIARRLRNEMLVKTDRQIAEARSKLARSTGSVDPPRSGPRIVRSRADAKALATRWLAMCDIEADRSPIDRCSVTNDLEADLSSDIHELQNGASDAAERTATTNLTAIESYYYVRFDREALAPSWLSELIRRASLEAAQRSYFRMFGSRHDPEDTFFPTTDPLAPEIPAEVTLEALIADYRRRQNTSRSSKTAHQRAAQDRFVLEFFGTNQPVSAITRQSAHAYIDAIINLRPHARKRHPGLTLPELAKLDDVKERISATSANTYIDAFRSLMAYAAEEGVIPNSPVPNRRASGDGVLAVDKRRAFSEAQLRLIFDAPLYRGCLDDQEGYATPGPNVIRRARFWVPLLALYTGARMNELCQLFVSDIDCRGKSPRILICIDAGGIKRLKSPSAARVIPLHSEMVRFGFLSFVESVRQQGHERLFHELEVGATGYFSHSFSKWFRRFLRHSRADRDRTTFHSFRHTFRTALTRARLSKEVAESLQGWSGGGMHSVYDKGFHSLEDVWEADRDLLAADMERVRYPNIDLSHLYV